MIADLLAAAPWLYTATFWTHVSAVTLSIALFAARGAGVLTHHAWPMQANWRRLSVGIDVVLLCAGIGLWTLGQRNPIEEHWLGMKLLLLPVYVVLGSYALKRARTHSARTAFFFAALACVLTMVSIAYTRQPWGWLSGTGSGLALLH